MPDFWFRDPWYFLAAFIVLLIPGLAVQFWLRGDSEDQTARPDRIALLADTIALSIALTALAGLWLWVVGIQLAGWMTAALYALCLLAVLAALLVKDFRLLRWPVLRGILLALLLMGLLTAWRFYQAQGLALPAWVDSVHHTLLVRVILEQGGLPRDFQPYIPAPAYYHYGFHLIAALHAFWAGLTPDRSVLWLGQVLNAAVALSVYRAAYAFRAASVEETDRFQIPTWLPALIAALLVGFAFQMPAYYVSWGRYTLLTGLILLGPAIAAAFELRGHPRSKTIGLRLAVIVGGLCAAHYFALLLAGLFMAALGLFMLIRAARSRSAADLLRMGGWALLGLLLALPWIIWVYQHTQQQATLDLAYIDQTENTQQRVSDLLNYLRYLLGPRHNYFLLGYAAAGLLLASFRKPFLRPFALWTILLCILSLPWGLRFGPFRPDHYVIILFFPAAILLSELLVQAVAALILVLRPPEPLGHEAGLILLGLVVGGLLVWGARQTRQVANPVTIIANQADVEALDWVKANIPADARFFVNTARWQAVYRGVDGGYWLMPYAGRMGLIPPTFYSWGPPEYVKQMTSWSERAQNIDGCTLTFWDLVREAELTHVYLREGVGRLQPAAVQSCPNLQQIYQQNGVYIYKIDQ